MFVGRVVSGALLCSALLAAAACGERAGDPVLGPSGEQDLSDASAGPIGLCGDCSSSADCGDANDACIRRQGAAFCGRDCDDLHRCPEGYECLAINDNRLRQCVPRSGCAEPQPAPAATQFRERVLARVNADRAAHDQPPLEPSACLDELAQASALLFARTDEPLAKYVKECDPIWPSCECGWSAEAELVIAAYDLDWRDAIDGAIGASGATVNADFTRALLADDATQIGVGFWLSADELWIALSFG
jgi:hypothetical protein